MRRPDGPVQQPAPDLDQLLDAFVALIEAATYADAVRRADEIAIHRSFGRRPRGAFDFPDDANRTEEAAKNTLYEMLDHERTMRLIPMLGNARWRTAARAEDAYQALAASELAQSDKVAGDADGDADGVS